MKGQNSSWTGFLSKDTAPSVNEPFDIKDFVFVCPTCGSTNVETIEGQELSIVEMEVE